MSAKSKNVKLSIIIPCFNGEKWIAAQLNALVKQKWSEAWEIIVADNKSTDSSMEIVKTYKNKLPHLRIVDASAKSGQPYAMNVGARAAFGESIAFCDADDEMAPGWIAAMGEALKKVDFVACRFEMHKLNSSKYYKKHSQEDGLMRYSHPDYLPYAGGCGLGVKRWIFESVGGFDEEMIYVHDTDFCFKVQLAGHELNFVPDAVMHIRSRESLNALFKQSKGYGEYNVLLYKKYVPLGMPKLTFVRGLIFLLYAFGYFIKIRTREDFLNWFWHFASVVGRFKGCIKYRVFAL